MKSNVEDISPVKKKLNIEIASESVTREMDRALADVAKKAKIPGFRPGKAPKTIVEKHYGNDVRSDVMHKLITDSYLQAVEEHKLNPVELPAIDDVSPLTKGEPLNFSATVEVRPNIELGTYEGIEVKDQEIAVTEEELNQTLDRLREMYAQLEVVEGRVLEKGDTAIIDFEGVQDGKPIAGAKASDYLLEIGSNMLIPGFEEQVIGMNPGESRDIQVTFPEDYANKELAGKDATFHVALKEIKKKVLPELNDEFAKDIGNDKTVDELKEGIRKDIEIRKRNELASAQREELLGKLVEAHTFDVPSGMVERELQSMANSYASRLARQGMDTRTLDVEKFREENRTMAEKRVKGVLLLDDIAEKENIDISSQELSQALTLMAQKSGQTVEAIKNYYESKDGGTDSLKSSLIQEKTLTFLLSRAKKSYN